MDPRHATIISVFAIAVLAVLGFFRGVDVSGAIAAVACATVGAHAGADAMRSFGARNDGVNNVSTER